MSNPTAQASLWGKCRWPAAPRIDGSETGRQAAQLLPRCVRLIQSGKGSQQLDCGALNPADMSCLCPDGLAAPGTWKTWRQKPQALLGDTWDSRLPQAEGLEKESAAQVEPGQKLPRAAKQRL